MNLTFCGEVKERPLIAKVILKCVCFIASFVDVIEMNTRNWIRQWYSQMVHVTLVVIILIPVLCPKLTLIRPTWSAYLYYLVLLIWHPYSLVFLIWYPYALTSLYGKTAHCSGYDVAMGCYGLFIVSKTAIVTSQ